MSKYLKLNFKKRSLADSQPPLSNPPRRFHMRGEYRADAHYRSSPITGHDLVEFDGSIWLAKRSGKLDKPGTNSTDFTCCAHPGKNAFGPNKKDIADLFGPAFKAELEFRILEGMGGLMADVERTMNQYWHDLDASGVNYLDFEGA